MGIVERKRRQRDTLRQQILDAALEVFATEGIQRVSMRRLAEKIEYSTSTIYLHFKSKDELFECVCEETFIQLGNLFTTIVESDRSPLEILQECCRAYVEFGLENPQQYTVAFLLDSQQRMAPEEVVRHFPNAMKAYLQLHTEVSKCIEIGHFANGDANLLSQVIWASLHGLTALLIQKPSFPWCDKDKLIDQLIGTIVLVASIESCPTTTMEVYSCTPIREQARTA